MEPPNTSKIFQCRSFNEGGTRSTASSNRESPGEISDTCEHLYLHPVDISGKIYRYVPQASLVKCHTVLVGD